MIRIVLLMVMLVAACSCSRDLGVVLPYERSKLVVTAIFSAGESVTVTVDHTYPPTGESLYDDGVLNAQVLIYENGQIADTLYPLQENKYTSKRNFRPVVGRSYRVSVNAPNYPSLASDTEIMPGFPNLTKTNIILANPYRIETTIQDNA